MSAALHALSAAPTPAALRAAARGARIAFTRALLLADLGRQGAAEAARRLAEQAYRAYLGLVADGASDAVTEELEGLHLRAELALELLEPSEDDGDRGIVLVAAEDIETYLTSGRPGRVDGARLFAAPRGPAVTLTSVRTGAHLTYRIRRASPVHPIWHIERRAAGDTWAYIGGLYRDAVSPNGETAGRTYRFVQRDSHAAAGAFGWFVRNVLAPSADLDLNSPVNVWAPARCGRCSRELTDDLSIARGLGPICHKRVHGH